MLPPKLGRLENSSDFKHLNEIATGRFATKSSFFDVGFSACAWRDCFANKASENYNCEDVGQNIQKLNLNVEVKVGFN